MRTSAYLVDGQLAAECELSSAFEGSCQHLLQSILHRAPMRGSLHGGRTSAQKVATGSCRAIAMPTSGSPAIRSSSEHRRRPALPG
jgi:hypothetical protein